MNMNSRGCQPTEKRIETVSTLEGAHDTVAFGPLKALMIHRCEPRFSPAENTHRTVLNTNETEPT